MAFVLLCLLDLIIVEWMPQLTLSESLVESIELDHTFNKFILQISTF